LNEDDYLADLIHEWTDDVNNELVSSKNNALIKITFIFSRNKIYRYILVVI
jgi:hypothetical protein